MKLLDGKPVWIDVESTIRTRRNAFIELVRGIWFWIVLVLVGSATYGLLSTLPHPWWLISILIIFAIAIFALLRNRSKRGSH